MQLSYPEPEVPFELNMEDFMKVAMDYRIFETGMDASLLKDVISESVAVDTYNKIYGLESEGIV